MTKTCIECGGESWNGRSDLCQAHFDKALEKKIDEMDIAKDVNIEHPSNKWY
ncbi:hypothetical protein GCM10011409_46050 [Lentibacillus populi]|uniref:Uncharacterized protein n=1 Tax=Lentibacillus populi TaxID=1827502 RepID=A0A9W5X7P9_9BACI|nr:hypothetical protein [Lentibacillus populi]GGB63776.1 hypothetical protein GCM10011409_46050 [Lentibacillus populi]